MTTSEIIIKSKPLKYITNIYAPTPKREPFESFSGMPMKSDIKVYGIPDRHTTLYKILCTATTGTREMGGYITPSAIKLESYDELFPKHILQQPIEGSKPMQESISILKPEIVGLGLGGIVSFGIGIAALATNNTGIATVMAGPFLASLLGFALLLIGIKRKKQ